jgi:8-oxo-dGTP diphosphatase
VMEETGHAVAVHEFLGTLVYETRGGPKVVHYWRMEAGHTPVRELMRDVKAVDWLPLEEALERLSRGYERAFLQHVGPMAMAAAGGVVGAVLPKAAEPALREHKAGRVGFLQNLLRLFR